MSAWPIFRGERVELVQTSHQQLAVSAAQSGNWKPADRLELDRLLQRVYPHTAEGDICSRPMLTPIEILRGAGPGGEDCARWTFDLECGQCEGEGYVDYDDEDDFGSVREICSRCRGTGVDAEEQGEFITDLGGVVLAERLP